MPLFTKYKHNRQLHERSFLTLEFPRSDDRVLRTFIPFLENPTITEKGAANLNTYNLVGRAGQLFAYAGAQSRKINVTFRISFQHLIEVDAEEGIADRFKRQFLLYYTDEDARSAFNLRKEADLLAIEQTMNEGSEGLSTFDILDNGIPVLNADDDDLKILDKRGYGRDYASTHRAYFRKVAAIRNQDPRADRDDFSEFIKAQRDNNKNVDLVYCWLNLIRATVLNNSNNTTYGPPIVRLTHGPMYGNVPCLVEDYSVKIIEEGGYEAQTLTPKIIEITLSMVESRTGDFGEYVAGKTISGDNLTGWESIISNNEIDPYNGVISGEGDDYAVL